MSRYRRSLLMLIGIAAFVACSKTADNTGDEKGIVVTDLKANMTLPTSTGSFWMKISNYTDKDDALIGADVEGCGTLEFHEMIIENDVMFMHQVEGGEVPIPSGETVELKQGGLHIMCIDKAEPLIAGTTIDVILQFANAGPIKVEADVVPPGGMAQ